MGKAIRIAISVLYCVLLISCGGGGGGGGNSVTTAVRFSVHWGERSRSFDGPGSALSMVLRIVDAGVPNGDFLYSVNRDADPSEHTTNYTSGPLAKSGSHMVTATFYADPNAAGDVVGYASGPMTLQTDGTLVGTISTTGTIASVQVISGQSVTVGQTRQLDFTARNSVGNIVAVSPGSALWNVVSGTDKLAFEDGNARGLIVGDASVTATVDGATSAAATISVSTNPNISVTVSPQAAVVLPNGTKQFTASVTGTSNTDVTWSVLTQGGGSIGGSGLYTAPGAIMYATVEARSIADPSKAGTAIVTVQDSTLTVTVTPNPASVEPGETQQFTAVVGGSPNQNVAWSVVEVGGGSISSSGLYTAPMTEAAYTVKATSVADAGFEGSAAVLVQASKIAFCSRRDGNYEIYVMSANGANQTNISNNPDPDFLPSWSPDRTKIAFASRRDGNSEVYVMNADGSNQTRLTFDPSDDHEPAWSPDGTKIAFGSVRDGNEEIYVMNADGSNQTRITNNLASDEKAAWSPDGSKIAFSSSRDGDPEIYVMHADGSAVVQITNNAVDDYSAAWSPDGGKIVFQRLLNGNTDIWVMNPDGSSQAQLTENSTDDRLPVWSPSGSKIAFTTDRHVNEEIYVMNADGSSEIRITNNNSDDFKPDW